VTVVAIVDDSSLENVTAGMEKYIPKAVVMMELC
jgi:hypothetical protein